MFQDTRPAVLGLDPPADAWAAFRVTDPRELLRLLKQLRDGSVPVHLSAPQGAAVTSQVWSLDDAQQQMSFSADEPGLPMQQLARCMPGCRSCCTDSSAAPATACVPSNATARKCCCATLRCRTCGSACASST